MFVEQADENNAENFQVKGAIYLGCFKDKEDRAISAHYFDLVGFGGEVRSVCHSYALYYSRRIYGLQDGRHCFIGLDNGNYAKHGRGDACNKLCDGVQGGINCGGVGQSDVYVVS